MDYQPLISSAPIVTNVTKTSIDVTYSWNSTQISTLEYRVLDESLNEIIPWTELPPEGQPTNGINSYTFTIEGLSSDTSYYVEMKDTTNSNVISVGSGMLIDLSSESSSGAIAGIIIGMLVGVGLIGGGIWFGIKKDIIKLPKKKSS